MMLHDAPFKATNFIPRDIEIERRGDGTLLMRSRVPLVLGASSLCAYLRVQSAAKPDAPWIFERNAQRDSWRSISFAQARASIDSLTQALLDLGLPSGASLVILSENSIEHALLTYACFQAGIPVVPVTPAYALQSETADKLNERLAAVHPGAVFVQNAARYAGALAGLDPALKVIAVDAPRAGDLHFADMVRAEAGDAVERAFAGIDIDAPARYMFTSGSSGTPKAVIQTQRNILVAVESNLTAFGQKGGAGVVRLDWMPWSHVTGAAVLAATLISGGRFYIDDGRPLGKDFAKTLDNLKDVSPTAYFSMPAGYVMLVDALEQDEALAWGFFEKLMAMGYGGARMPDDVARRLQDLAVRHTGHKIPFTCGYGSTETGPGGALVYWPTDRVGMIGLPQPGYDLKLVPLDDDRFEVRVRSDAVTPGYLGLPEATAAMLDDEGYYRMGDAAAFNAPEDPLEGLVFAGRLSDEFKLVTGTFVRTNELTDLLLEATAPLLKYIVVCGEGERFVAVLGWLNLAAARSFVGDPDAGLEALNRHPAIVQQIAEAMARYNTVNGTSSRRIRRFLLQDEEASAALGELADKGSIRNSNVRRRRADQVRQLFLTEASGAVVTVPE